MRLPVKPDEQPEDVAHVFKLPECIRGLQRVELAVDIPALSLRRSRFMPVSHAVKLLVGQRTGVFREKNYS